MLVRIVAAPDLQIAKLLLRVRSRNAQPRDAVDHVDRQAETVDLVVDGQFQRCVDVALLLVPAHVHVFMIGAAVSQPVDQPRVTVKIEDDRFIQRKQAVEVGIR